MTDLINAGQTMTSLQIAEVTGKKHCDVLRAIRNMEPSWEKITARKFASRFKINELANGVKKETPYYELTKTECLYIATKFNDEARARLILRWEELENEKLAALQQPQQLTEAETLPPPSIDNQRVTRGLVEVVDGKAVTTSRKLAELLGRKHDSVIDTIKSNLHQRAFKYGNFTKRPYSDGPAHGYEFLITRSGLEALASIMRYSARDCIAEAYATAWNVTPKQIPATAPAVVPAQVAIAQPVASATEEPDEISYTPEQQKYIDFLESYNEDLGNQLRKAKETLKTYTDMYEHEKQRKIYSLERSGYWHDLYEDLMWRVGNGTDGTIDERVAAHEAFKKRILGR